MYYNHTLSYCLFCGGNGKKTQDWRNMDYEEARVYLDDAAKYGSVLGLQNMEELLAELENPQDKLKFIHIAGTNGKGSVLAFLSTILQKAGYRVGRYISPTLFSYRERIQVNGEYIKRESLAAHVTRIRRVIGQMTARGRAHPTLFEIETALSFLYFLEQKCDIVVLETGMGGDTDATNVIRTTALEVLVSISMDHMQLLGNSLAEIAAHKAGIIKPHTEVVSAPQEPEALEVIRQKAKEQGARLTVAQVPQTVSRSLKGQTFSYGPYRDLRIRLTGTYQIENAAVAVEAAEALKRLGYEITQEQLRAGLQETVWNGRFTVLLEHPLFIMDGAHNRAGAERLKESIEAYLAGRRITAICGVFADKEYERILETEAPYLQRMITVQTPGNPRALQAKQLAEAARKYIGDVQAAASIEDAVKRSFALAGGTEDAILAFGSLSFLGELAEAVRNIAEKEKTP